MPRKTALVVTAILTAFVLVLAIGVGVRLARGDNRAGGPPSPVDAPGAGETVTPDLDSLRQREALLQQRLEEANRRLQEAYRQIESLQQEVLYLQGASGVEAQGLQASFVRGERGDGGHELWEHEREEKEHRYEGPDGRREERGWRYGEEDD